MDSSLFKVIEARNKYDELGAFIKEYGIKNLLVGNGYSLAHPIFRSAFEWDLETALSSEWSRICPDITMSAKCPETDLQIIRSNLLKNIIIYYINNFVKFLPKINNNYCSCRNIYNPFCSIAKRYSQIGTLYESILFDTNHNNFCNIFTLNYDPLMYLDFLVSGNSGPYIDGFKGSDKFRDQEFIVKNLEEATKKNTGNLIFLHGSWFIISNENNHLKKTSFSKNHCITDINQFFTYPHVPYLILEDRYEVKEMILKSCDRKNYYFKKNYDRLRSLQSESILVLGCSFNKDLHILKALIESSIEKIYVSYLESEPDYNRELSEKVNKLGLKNESQNRINLLPLGPQTMWKFYPSICENLLYVKNSLNDFSDADNYNFDKIITLVQKYFDINNNHYSEILELSLSFNRNQNYPPQPHQNRLISTPNLEALLLCWNILPEFDRSIVLRFFKENLRMPI